MTDFDLDLVRARAERAAVRDHGAMPRAARRAERLAYSDDAQDRDPWRQVRREVAEIFERLG